MAREGGEGKKEDTRESGSEPSVSRAQRTRYASFSSPFIAREDRPGDT